MKYIAPEFAAIVVDTEDVILASGGTFVPGDNEGNATTPDEEL